MEAQEKWAYALKVGSVRGHNQLRLIADEIDIFNLRKRDSASRAIDAV
jgi:hypothetical protein